ncbi:copper-binding protein [Sodalis sp. dw_96]|uniref:copper-binding protein n=1 Tax=Sodalis sp. dw_96 TaxID=2719794 RepID=UPI0021074186|nr:copper-binding protein [Sodalis sp. dw_96]
MRALFIIVISAISLFTLPVFADDMAAMGDMPGMQHDNGMMTAADAAASDYHSQGIVKLWDNQHVAIAHHAIPALNWPPMTMTFAVPPAFAGQKLAVGTQVDFSFRQDAQGYQLTAIHPVQP